MIRIVFIFFATAVVFCLWGCSEFSDNSNCFVSKSADLIETEHDIFNLNWGCSKGFADKNCDFGGKQMNKIADSYYKVNFSKGSVFTRFFYNLDGNLYEVSMSRYFLAKDFAAAVDFFFYMNALLREKYPDANNPKSQSNRQTLNGYYKYMHLPTEIKWEHFMLSHFFLQVEFETKTTFIGLSVTPWSRPNSFDTIPVFLLTYRSKQIRSNSKIRNDLTGSDSRGL